MLLRELFLASICEHDRRPYQGGECIGTSDDDEEIYVSSPLPVGGTADGLPVWQYQLCGADGFPIGVAFPVQLDGDSDDPFTGSFNGFRVEAVLGGAAAIKEAAMLAVYGRSPSSRGEGSITVRQSFDGKYSMVSIELSVFDVWTYGPHIVGSAEVTTSAWIAELAAQAAQFGIDQSDQLADWRAAT